MLRNAIENLQLDVHQLPSLAEHAAAIRALGRQTLQNVIEIGRRLSECRAVLRKDGEWHAWLKSEFDWSDQHARRLIHLYEQAPKLNKLLSGNFDLPISALYLLAAPKTPEAARTEIAECAKSGEPMPVAKVERIIAAAKGEANLGENAVTDDLEDTTREQDALVKISRRVPRRARRPDVEHALNFACLACENVNEMDMSAVPQAKRTDLIARISEAVAILLRFRNQLGGEDRTGPTEPALREDIGAGQVERLRARVDELQGEKRLLEFKIIGFQSEIEELRARLPVDADGIPEFLRRPTPAEQKGGCID
jgi:Protein of unknown function (DUF3102)